MKATDRLIPVPGANQNGSPTDPAKRLVKMSDGTFAEMVVVVNVDGSAVGGSGGGGTATTQTESLYYTVITAFTGASVGDVLSNIQSIDLTTGEVLSETWTNLSTNAAIDAPASANVSLQSTAGLTAAQLAAAGLAKDSTALQILNAIKAQGGGESVIDSASTPVIWWMVTDPATNAVTYYQYGTTTVGTPTLPVKPYEYTSGSVSVKESALPAGAATEASVQAITTSLGTDGPTPPPIAGTGVCGWLRGIFEKLAGTLNVSVSSLPGGLATTSGQAAIVTTLGAPMQQTGGSVAVSNFPATQAVSAAALPLPEGASTAALQTTGNTSLANIDADIGTTADAAWSGTGTGSVIATLKGIFGKLANTLTVAIQQLFSYSANNSTNGTSTAFTVATGSSWVGTLEATINQNFATISVISTQAVTVTVNQYLDAAGTIVDVLPVNFSVAANTPYTFPIAVQGNYVKLSVSNASGASASVTVDTYYGPLPVEPASLTQAGNKRAAIMEPLPAGTNIIGKTGIDQTTYGNTNAVMVGGTSQVQVTPAVTAASAYVTGNVVGGLLTFANVVQATVLSGVLESVTLAIKSTQTATFKLYLFRSAPSATFTDKTAPAINAADAALLLDVITLSGGDSGLGANATLYVADNIGKSLVLAGAALYGVLVVTGTPTFTTTSDVVVTASILKD